jgi:hypothetical protein
MISHMSTGLPSSSLSHWRFSPRRCQIALFLQCEICLVLDTRFVSPSSNTGAMIRYHGLRPIKLREASCARLVTQGGDHAGDPKECRKRAARCAELAAAARTQQLRNTFLELSKNCEKLAIQLEDLSPNIPKAKPLGRASGVPR